MKPQAAALLSLAGGVHGQHDGGDDEGGAVAEVAEYERPATPEVVDEQDAQRLGNEGDDGRDGLILQRVVPLDAHEAVDGDRVVLDGRNASQLDGRLDGASKEETAEAGLVGEELDIRLGLMLVLVRDGVLDLLELGLHPRIGGVAVGVELGKCSQTELGLAMVDEPARRLGKEKDEGGEEHGGDDLNAQRGPPLAAVGGSATDVGALK